MLVEVICTCTLGSRAETCCLCNKLYISIPPYSCVRQVYKLQSSYKHNGDDEPYDGLEYYSLATAHCTPSLMSCNSTLGIGQGLSTKHCYFEYLCDQTLCYSCLCIN